MIDGVAGLLAGLPKRGKAISVDHSGPTVERGAIRQEAVRPKACDRPVTVDPHLCPALSVKLARFRQADYSPARHRDLRYFQTKTKA